jgi:DNA-binding response OmpR family regulator
VGLTGTELRFLRHLAAEPVRVFSKEELLRDDWGYRSMGRTAPSIRTPRGSAASSARLAPTGWSSTAGVGYRLLDAVQTPEEDGAP